MDQAHLRSLRIERFRGLEGLELEDLGDFNLLVGANDVGKTSVLEAAYLLCGPVNLELPFRLQNFRHIPAEKVDDLRLLFRNLDVKEAVRIGAECSGPLSHIEIEAAWHQEDGAISTGTQTTRALEGSRASSAARTRPSSIRWRASWRESEGEERSYDLSIRDQSDGEFLLEVLKDKKASPPVSANLVLAGYGQFDVELISDLRVHKKIARLVRHLQALNPQVQDLATSGTHAYVDVGLQEMLPMNLFGAGLARAASIAALAIQREDPLLLIDEIENGLHHKAVGDLLRALLALSRERRLQIIATTHRLDVLQALDNLLAEEGNADHRATTNCFALQRDQHGRVRSYRYDHEQFSHNVRYGLEIR